MPEGARSEQPAPDSISRADVTSSSMRSSLHCLAKAIEMEAKAATCGDDAARVEYAQMAADWRELAALAAWQDRWTNDHPDF
jgi:hypothetical protein